MNYTYHLCRSSHREVMFRSETDLIIGFNYLAVAAFETDSVLLADGFLPTHYHEVARTDDPKALAKRQRYSYTRYFNAKYHRKGSLGEKTCFILKVDGLYHTQALLNYVNRQGLHHGLSATPFGYKHCSANAYFREELGRDLNPQLIDNWKRHEFLPCNVPVPLSYRMSESGLLLREDIEDTAYVESVYVSPRNFLYQMNRISDEKDITEQVKENSSPALTLAAVERGVPAFNPSKAFITEQGRINKSRMTDIELCHIIDDVILPERYFKPGQESSIYLLPERVRQDLGNSIWQESQAVRFRGSDSVFAGKTVTKDQISRCLCL